jgi:hypothetical protein
MIASDLFGHVHIRTSVWLHNEHDGKRMLVETDGVSYRFRLLFMPLLQATALHYYELGGQRLAIISKGVVCS